MHTSKYQPSPAIKSDGLVCWGKINRSFWPSWETQHIPCQPGLHTQWHPVLKNKTRLERWFSGRSFSRGHWLGFWHPHQALTFACNSPSGLSEYPYPHHAQTHVEELINTHTVNWRYKFSWQMERAWERDAHRRNKRNKTMESVHNSIRTRGTNAQQLHDYS